MKYQVMSILGDTKGEVVGESDDLEEAIQLANDNCEDAEPTEEEKADENFSWEDYSGYARVTSTEFDGIVYWVNGGGDTGTDLAEGNEDYEIVMRNM